MNRAKAAIAAGTGFVLFLAVWATTAGQVKLFTNEGSSVQRPEPTALTPGPLVPTSANTREIRDPLAPGASTFVTVLTTLVCLIFAVGLLYYLWGARQERKTRERREASGSDFDVLADDDLDIGGEVPSQLTQATEDQLTELLLGDPRNAIVGCWLALEEAAKAVGSPRRPAETSMEFTARVLASYAVDKASLSVLAELYREARFSRHELGEAERQDAVDALRRLDTDLRERRLPAAASAPERGPA